jgi:hypothetical protein
MPDDQAAADGEENASETPPREKATTGIKRRIQRAEEIASEAVAAEALGDHRAAAELYKRAIDTLEPPADQAANDAAPSERTTDDAPPETPPEE